MIKKIIKWIMGTIHYWFKNGFYIGHSSEETNPITDVTYSVDDIPAAGGTINSAIVYFMQGGKERSQMVYFSPVYRSSLGTTFYDRHKVTTITIPFESDGASAAAVIDIYQEQNKIEFIENEHQDEYPETDVEFISKSLTLSYPRIPKDGGIAVPTKSYKVKEAERNYIVGATDTPKNTWTSGEHSYGEPIGGERTLVSENITETEIQDATFTWRRNFYLEGAELDTENGNVSFLSQGTNAQRLVLSVFLTAHSDEFGDASTTAEIWQDAKQEEYDAHDVTLSFGSLLFEVLRISGVSINGMSYGPYKLAMGESVIVMENISINQGTIEITATISNPDVQVEAFATGATITTQRINGDQVEIIARLEDSQCDIQVNFLPEEEAED